MLYEPFYDLYIQFINSLVIVIDKYIMMRLHFLWVFVIIEKIETNSFICFSPAEASIFHFILLSIWLHQFNFVVFFKPVENPDAFKKMSVDCFVGFQRNNDTYERKLFEKLNSEKKIFSV